MTTPIFDALFETHFGPVNRHTTARRGRPDVTDEQRIPDQQPTTGLLQQWWDTAARHGLHGR